MCVWVSACVLGTITVLQIGLSATRIQCHNSTGGTNHCLYKQVTVAGACTCPPLSASSSTCHWTSSPGPSPCHSCSSPTSVSASSSTLASPSTMFRSAIVTIIMRVFWAQESSWKGGTVSIAVIYTCITVITIAVRLIVKALFTFRFSFKVRDAFKYLVCVESPSHGLYRLRAWDYHQLQVC